MVPQDEFVPGPTGLQWYTTVFKTLEPVKETQHNLNWNVTNPYFKILKISFFAGATLFEDLIDKFHFQQFWGTYCSHFMAWMLVSKLISLDKAIIDIFVCGVGNLAKFFIDRTIIQMPNWSLQYKNWSFVCNLGYPIFQIICCASVLFELFSGC